MKRVCGRVGTLGLGLMLVLLGACSDDAATGKSDTEAGDLGAEGDVDAKGGDVTAGDDAADASDPDAAEEVAPAKVCPPGVAGCVSGQRLVCNDVGSAFELEDCAEGLACFEGVCVGCISAADCAEAEDCADGECVPRPLTIETVELPPVLEGAAYAFTLEATGGAPPYTWSVGQGNLPPGITLAADGVLSGASVSVGSFSFRADVLDAAGTKDTEILSLVVLEHGLHITTGSPLPLALEGEPYQTTLKAVGGTAPWFWGLSSGALPPGLSLASDGTISGTPTGDGTFEFTAKVFDNGDPTLTASKALKLPVSIAPLEILGDQQIDLFVTKVIVLPLILVVDGIPVPYNAKLQAKGGKKPYAWAEEPIPGLVKTFIPKSGLPTGLTLAANGTLSGAVTDTSLAVEITIPFTQIKLSGFFFAARVTDAQGVPDQATALYIIPTAPIAL